MQKKKERIFYLSAIFIIVIFVVVNIDIHKKKELIQADYNGLSEALFTSECAEIFDVNPTGCFLISFDLRSDTDGPVQVSLYESNGNRRYWMEEKIVCATTDFQHFELECYPKIVDEKSSVAHLFFYGGYGSGCIPHVKNIVIKEKE